MPRSCLELVRAGLRLAGISLLAAGRLALLALAVCLAAVGGRAGAAPATPNIVLLLADDMGWGDLHANNPASPVATPNLDRLAREGMRFTNAHTSAALCAPTRYSILTGNYQWRGRLGWGTWNYWFQSQILPGQLTLGDILRQAGYRTAFVGKLHMGGDFYGRGTGAVTRDQAQVDFGRPFRNGPREHGFDYDFALLAGIQEEPYAYFENDRLVGDPARMRLWNVGKYRAGASEIIEAGRGMPYWNSSQVGPDLVGKATAFIDRHLAGPDAKRPFLLYYAAQAAHEPYTPPATFAGKPVRGVTGLCARQDMIREADLALGHLHDYLDRKGLLADTLFVFTSDNGGVDECGQDASGPAFTGHKSQILEGGHRVPLIVKWGRKGAYTVPPGTVRNQLIGAHDLAASLAGITGVTLAADQARDSFDFAPVWLGTRPDANPVRPHLMVEARNSDIDVPLPSTLAYYEGNWKLVVQKSGAGYAVVRLAELKSDPGERIDRALDPAQASRVQGMLARFTSLRQAARTAP